MGPLAVVVCSLSVWRGRGLVGNSDGGRWRLRSGSRILLKGGLDRFRSLKSPSIFGRFSDKLAAMGFGIAPARSAQIFSLVDQFWGHFAKISRAGGGLTAAGSRDLWSVHTLALHPKLASKRSKCQRAMRQTPDRLLNREAVEPDVLCIVVLGLGPGMLGPRHAWAPACLGAPHGERGKSPGGNSLYYPVRAITAPSGPPLLQIIQITSVVKVMQGFVVSRPLTRALWAATRNHPGLL
jgi:hypothetical protein